MISLLILGAVGCTDTSDDNTNTQQQATTTEPNTTTQTTTTQTTTTTTEPVQEDTERVYKIGEPVTVGERTYTVNSVTSRKSFDQGYGGPSASGIYAIVDITVENIGQQSGNLMSTDVVALDTENREYSQAILAGYVDNTLDFAQIQPGLKKQGNIGFDVPQNVPLRLKVTEGGFGSKYAIIDIGSV